jgi:hypothetical protein
MRRLRQLEEENRRLKSIVADQALDMRAFTVKKRLPLAVEREMVTQVIATHGLWPRRACGLIEITRRSFRCATRADRNQKLRQRLRALAEAAQCAPAPGPKTGRFSPALRS